MPFRVSWRLLKSRGEFFWLAVEVGMFPEGAACSESSEGRLPFREGTRHW